MNILERRGRGLREGCEGIVTEILFIGLLGRG